MSTTTERLLLKIESDVRGFIDGIGKLKQSIGDADGFFGKLKAGAGGLKDAFHDLGPGAKAGLAAGGIAAVGVAAFDAVTKFEHLGLAVGEFADKTHMSTQDASRWVEVAGDLGINADGLATVMGKLNKSINPAAFKELGIQIAYAKDGTVDANATFLNAIDRLHGMTDAGEQARAGAKLFGKGWQSVFELVSMSASDLKTRLQGVADVKILSPADVKDARDFRDTMKDLKDAGEEVVLTFGKALLPAVQAIASVLKDVAPALDVAGKGMGLIGEVAGGAVHGVEALGGALTELYNTSVGEDINGKVLDLSGAVRTLSDSIFADNNELAIGADKAKAHESATLALAAAMKDNAAKAADEMAAATKRAKQAAEELTAQWDTLKGSISNDQAFLTIQDQFDQVKASAKEAWDTTAAGADNAAAKVRANKQDVDTLKQSVINYGKEVGGLPPQRVTQILAMIDQGSLDAAEAAIDRAARNRQVSLDIQAKGGSGIFTVKTGVAGAEGAIVNSPTVALIGEAGPEALIPLDKLPGNGSIPDMSRGGSAAGGGSTVVVNIYPRVMMSPRELEDAIAKARRVGARI